MSKHNEPNIHDKREEEQSDSSFADLADALNVDLKKETVAPSINELLKELDETKQKSQDSWDKFMRTQAEMANLRTRTERDIANAHRYALEKFVAELLPVLDSVEQGLQAADQGGAAASVMREGMEMTYNMLLKAVEKFGVVQLIPLDQAYDPHQHEAIAAIPSADKAPNTVLQVIQKGYSLHGRLVRPARVIVSKAED
ncbi:MAG: nucleotide exchange factor GrpE [Gammaproteobacteria bacterium]|nr:nucleotide exchange factor GrpE [Gammaproteobacteria bacterium]